MVCTTFWVFFLTNSKLMGRFDTYKKTMYLLTFLMYMGCIIAAVNLHFLIPIFFAIELGTVIFILVITRSNSSIFTINAGPARTTLLVGLSTCALGVCLNFSSMFVKYLPTLFVDLYSINSIKNDFISLYLVMVITNFLTTMCILALVVVLTAGIIFCKWVINYPRLGSKRPTPKSIDIFQKNKELFFFTKKNIFSFFKSS